MRGRKMLFLLSKKEGGPGGVHPQECFADFWGAAQCAAGKYYFCCQKRRGVLGVYTPPGVPCRSLRSRAMRGRKILFLLLKREGILGVYTPPGVPCRSLRSRAMRGRGVHILLSKKEVGPGGVHTPRSALPIFTSGRPADRRRRSATGCRGQRAGRGGGV